MTSFLLVVVSFIVFVLVYALALRPWLKTKAWAQGFFTTIEPAEIALFKKSETVLVGRLVWLGGLIVTAYDGFVAYFGSIDFEPLTARPMDFLHIPPDMRSFTLSAVFTALGLMIVRLREMTTRPLEVVAAPESLPPAAAAAVARAEVTKDAAVAAVQEAKS
jgi:hypothetical protein